MLSPGMGVGLEKARRASSWSHCLRGSELCSDTIFELYERAPIARTVLPGRAPRSLAPRLSERERRREQLSDRPKPWRLKRAARIEVLDEIEIQRGDEGPIADVHRELRVLIVVLVDLWQKPVLPLPRADCMKSDAPVVAMKPFLDPMTNRRLRGELLDQVGGHAADDVLLGERSRALAELNGILVCTKPSRGVAIDLSIDDGPSGKHTLGVAGAVDKLAPKFPTPRQELLVRAHEVGTPDSPPESVNELHSRWMQWVVWIDDTVEGSHAAGEDFEVAVPAGLRPQLSEGDPRHLQFEPTRHELAKKVRRSMAEVDAVQHDAPADAGKNRGRTGAAARPSDGGCRNTARHGPQGRLHKVRESVPCAGISGAQADRAARRPLLLSSSACVRRRICLRIVPKSCARRVASAHRLQPILSILRASFELRVSLDRSSRTGRRASAGHSPVDSGARPDAPPVHRAGQARCARAHAPTLK